MKEKKSGIDDYYKFPFSGENFDGDVVKIDAKNLDYIFQNYSDGDERKFREKLHRADEWFSDKPYKVYANYEWVRLIIKWLRAELPVYTKGKTP